MPTSDPTSLRSHGEAHLYVAVAKADGIISPAEALRAPYHARRSQDVLDIMGINTDVRETIRTNLKAILSETRYSTWDAHRHLDEAIRLLHEAAASGDWGAKMSGDRNEKGLKALALLDGYTQQESGFLREVKRRLGELE